MHAISQKGSHEVATAVAMRPHAAIETGVVGLGFELVDVERAAGGLLRVTIDHPAAAPGAPERAITVDDCERVTRQLQHVLEVEGVAYQRLEVSSPGLDRPLRSESDFARFVGAEIELTLKAPFQGRKRYRGTLERLAAGDWRVVLSPPPATPRAAGKRAGKSSAKPTRTSATGSAPEAADGTQQALDFKLDEVREARLVPVIDFKGRSSARPAALDATGHEQTEDGGRNP